MRKIKLVFLTVSLLTSIIRICAQENLEYKLAASYFFELDSLCTVDNGKLWGVQLYGPTMFVIPENRLIIANQNDKDKKLSEKDGVYLGILPESINISNTSFTWSGIDWTMVMWNALPQDDKYSRDKLLIHESWHRVQNEIGIKSVTSLNTHLDELRGAILIKLELTALKHSLLAEGGLDKKRNLENALIVRKYRQLLFPSNNENEFERHEGMAEYTGFKLCGINPTFVQKVIAKQLEFAMEKDGFTNSFAYLTGPAYGFLFDELDPGWIKKILQGNDIPTIGSGLFSNENITSDTTKLKSAITEIVDNYKVESLITTETEKFEQQKQLISKYEQKIFKGDQLIIPNKDVNFSFNPQEKLIPIDNRGVIYKTMRLSGDWGILEVQDGIFRSNDWQVFVVSAPRAMNTTIIKETDYNLTLNKGWTIVKIKDGKFTLTKE